VQTKGIAREAEPSPVRVVAVLADDSGGRHATRLECRPLVGFGTDLSVRMKGLAVEDLDLEVVFERVTRAVAIGGEG
jgi:hypothetical protein